jgi:hypothetical protein
MDVDSPRDRDKILARYQHLRSIGLVLNQRLVESLDREAIQQSGQQLGILRDNVLHFDTDDVSSVLMDFAIRHARRDGRNAIERLLAKSPPPPTSDEMTILRAACDLRYGLFEAKKIFRGLGLTVWDMLRDETGLLVDVGFSRTAVPGFVIASHVQAIDDFWMTTGAALPVFPDFLRELLRQVRRRFGSTPEQYRSLSKEEHAELAALIIRTCLRKGAAESIRYGEPHFHSAHRSAPAPASRRVPVGRNDPCPCGSGRKYKNCCLRKA